MINRDRIAFWLCLLPVLSLPFFRGGYQTTAQLLATLFFGIALLICTPKPKSNSILMSFVHGTWLLWLLWQLIHLAPLGMEQLTLISPTSAAQWHMSLIADLRETGSISIVPIEGGRQFIHSLGLYALYCCLLNTMEGSTNRRQQLLFAIVLIGTIQAIYGTTVHLTGWSLSWIEPKPPSHSSVAHGTFPNRNHFSAFLIIGVGACLSLLNAPYKKELKNWHSLLRRFLEWLNSPYLLVRVALMLMSIAIVLSQSRMGNIALVIMVSIFALIWLFDARSVVSFSKRLLLFSSIILVDFFVINYQFGFDELVQRLESTDLDGENRSIANSMSWQLIQQYRLTGAGHGAFSRLEHQVRPDAATPRFHHAHNDHAELILEFGWIGYSLLGGLLALHGLIAALSLKSARAHRRAVGALFIAICAVALLHASVEFIFHVPAYRSVFITLMALIASQYSQPGQSRRRRT